MLLENVTSVLVILASLRLDCQSLEFIVKFSRNEERARYFFLACVVGNTGVLYDCIFYDVCYHNYLQTIIHNQIRKMYKH